MSTIDLIVFAVVDLSVLAAIKMICNAWLASSATKRMDAKILEEFMRRTWGEEDE